MDEQRAGDWMTTYTGKKFWPSDPRPEDFNVLDVAHHLSMICRYNGAVERFYSVAEHSVLIAQAMAALGADDQLVLRALWHDGAEAYLCDVVRPVKRNLVGYEAMEHRIEQLMWEWLKLPKEYWEMPEIVHQFDDAIIYDEAMALLPSIPDNWHKQYAPGLGLGVFIEGWEPKKAQLRFLIMHSRYGGRPIS